MQFKKELLKNNKWSIFFPLVLFVLFNFIQLNIMSVLSVYIVRLFNISILKLGLIGSVYFYTNLFFIFFSGILLDLFSPKKIILNAICVSLLGIIFFVAKPSIFSLVIWRLTAGITCSFCITGSLKIIAKYFDDNEKGMIISLIGVTATFAGIISQLPLEITIQNIGVRGALILITIIGICSFWLIYFFVINDFVRNIDSFSQTLKESKKIFLNFRNLCAALFECMVNLPLFVLGALWGSLYLIKIYNIDNKLASIIVSMLFFGHIIGAPLFGFLTDIMNSRRILLLLGSGIAIACILLIDICSHYAIQVIPLLLLFLFLGISTGTQIVTDAFVVNSNGNGVGRAVSLMSLVSVSGGAIFQPIFGFIVQSCESITMGYQKTMLIMLITSFFTFIMGFYIPKKDKKIIIEQNLNFEKCVDV